MCSRRPLGDRRSRFMPLIPNVSSSLECLFELPDFFVGSTGTLGRLPAVECLVFFALPPGVPSPNWIVVAVVGRFGALRVFGHVISLSVRLQRA